MDLAKFDDFVRGNHFTSTKDRATDRVSSIGRTQPSTRLEVPDTPGSLILQLRQIRKVYTLQIELQWHPDRNPDGEGKTLLRKWKHIKKTSKDGCMLDILYHWSGRCIKVDCEWCDEIYQAGKCLPKSFTSPGKGQKGTGDLQNLLSLDYLKTIAMVR